MEAADEPFVSGHSVSEHLQHCLAKYCPGRNVEEARRLYFEITTCVGIPGPFALRDNLRVPIPMDASLVGMEFFAQPVAMPIVLQPWQSPLTLPAGGRFVVQ